MLALAVLLLLAVASPISASSATLPHSSQLTLKNMFLKQLTASKASIPSGTKCNTCLLSSASYGARSTKGHGSVTYMEGVLRSKGYPKSVIDRLKSLAFAHSTKFHIYNIDVNANTKQGKYESYMAAGRKIANGRVEFGVIKGYSTAALVRKTQPIKKKSCKKILFFKKCSTKTEHITRGNTAQELKNIEQALRHYAQISMNVLANRHYS